ncbi:histone-lysine N-methyltransferase SETMAR [Trichonephila clavipes]|uniref:Histone-lysine N-methyltransferase SETMAR n=1 Tax=Trichonephila clavipes TaxID=2585209 RepID=A0A8X6S3A5_TRICX|nr:histone-lysine N-methyltransferase SETMAR [Trichonephila clavipes]
MVAKNDANLAMFPFNRHYDYEWKKLSEPIVEAFPELMSTMRRLLEIYAPALIPTRLKPRDTIVLIDLILRTLTERKNNENLRLPQLQNQLADTAARTVQFRISTAIEEYKRECEKVQRKIAEKKTLIDRRAPDNNRFEKGKNAVQAKKKLTDVYREGVLAVRQCQNWFAKFRSGNFDVEDAPRSGRLLLSDNTTINSEVYCHQLDKLNDALQQKRSELINGKGVAFHQDNARPHTSLVTRQKLLQLEWDTMPHPPYSPDLAPSDYYLFRSLQNFLDGKTFTSNEKVENHLDQFFASKDQKFYERGIMLLLERWQKLLDQNGQYII